ncbi:MAG: hypothetical protein H0W53_22185 [Acidobacteria bacterium]|nr:hypothetical protein [Acidobacteriota bacterium]
MTGRDADHWMTDHLDRPFFFQERMSAVTGILDESIARSDAMHAVPEQTAQVADLFLEFLRRPVRVAILAEHQRVPALQAHVLVMPVAVGDPDVRVVSEKARECVPDACM